MSVAMGKQEGFGLIEVLIAAAVVAVGLLSVASLHSKLVGQSADSKARAEAVALAEARIEYLRNYTNLLNGRDEFDAAFADTAGFTNATTLDGVNATFTRAESVGDVGETKQVQVRVAWSDASGTDQEVVLRTEFGWESPRAVGDLARADLGPLVSGPTGRARVGEGELPVGALTMPNGDGTEIYDDGSGDLKLVVDDRIVLTLLDACQADGVCLDFVKINGRVYIDRATRNSLAAGSVQLIASDASFCQRYYTDADGNVVPVTSSTTLVPSTEPNGNYSYFDYRCYVGGGWYGNVGILLAGGLSQNDKFCQGDPVATDATWKQPRIAARRAYRGMLYKTNLSNVSGWDEDAGGDPIAYTVGIADGAVLPDPDYSDWVSGASYAGGDRVAYAGYVYQAKFSHSGSSTNPSLDGSRWLSIGAHGGHDFVVAQLAVSHTEGSYCTADGVMVRADSDRSGVPGAMFAGMPNDFFCLNPGHIDNYTATHSAPTTCPYPPTNGPAMRHIVSGTIVVTPETQWAEAISVQTSDGAGNCTVSGFVHAGGASTATYECEIYEWGGGWNGYVEISPNSTNVYCTDVGADGTADDRLHMSAVTGDAAARDFACVEGEYAIIEGAVISSNQNRRLSGATIDSIGGWCTIATDALSFRCTTGVFELATWSGAITFTTTGGVICGANVDSSAGTLTFTDLAPGVHTANIGIVNNMNTACPL